MYFSIDPMKILYKIRIVSVFLVAEGRLELRSLSSFYRFAKGLRGHIRGRLSKIHNLKTKENLPSDMQFAFYYLDTIPTNSIGD